LDRREGEEQNKFGTKVEIWPLRRRMSRYGETVATTGESTHLYKLSEWYTDRYEGIVSHVLGGKARFEAGWAMLEVAKGGH
jgi:hypothetical protein